MKRLLFLLLLILHSLLLLAQIGSMPERNVENVSDGVIVTYYFSNPNINENELVTGSYFWQYDGFGINDVSGEPAIPFRKDLIYIPADYSAKIELIDSIYNDSSLVLSPSLPYIAEDETLIKIDSINAYNGFFPHRIIKSDSLQSYQGAGLIRVTVMPIQYDYIHRFVRYYSKIQYKVSFIHNDNQFITRDLITNNSYNWNELLSNATLNYNNTIRPSLTRDVKSTWHSTPISKNMLILTINEYLDSIQHFIEWKKLKGYNVFIAAKRRGEWNVPEIEDTIRYFYDHFGIKYLLIMGGINDVPAKAANKGVTDYYYGLPPYESPGIPQIARGRIPMRNSYDMKNVVDKIIKYEKEPIQDSAFYSRGIHCAEFEDSIYLYRVNNKLIIIHKDSCEDRFFTLGSEEVRTHLMTNYGKNIYRLYEAETTVYPIRWNKDRYSYGDTITHELQRENYLWDACSTDVINKINEGAHYILHRDHGKITGWLHPLFTNADILNLQNEDKQPVVFSINCKTGMYQRPDSLISFAESFLKKTHGGCVAMIAATESSYSGYNDAMTLGFFDAIWPGLQPVYGLRGYSSYSQNTTPIYEIGKVLDMGLIRMSETFGTNNSTRNLETWELFHCFGDPSMRINTSLPCEFTEPLIYSRNDSIYVFAEDGDCQITFYNKTTKKNKSFKGNYAVYPNPTDSLIICLDRNNYIPYIWDYSKDMYIQNENIINESRIYKCGIAHIGRNVTPQKPPGGVNIQNSNITIIGNQLNLQPEIFIDKNFTFQNR